MQPRIAFCNRCRGMRVGWNKRYILHRLLCKQWVRNSTRLMSLAALTAKVTGVCPAGVPKPPARIHSRAAAGRSRTRLRLRKRNGRNSARCLENTRPLMAIRPYCFALLHIWIWDVRNLEHQRPASVVGSSCSSSIG